MLLQRKVDEVGGGVLARAVRLPRTVYRNVRRSHVPQAVARQDKQPAAHAAMSNSPAQALVRMLSLVEFGELYLEHVRLGNQSVHF